MKGPLFGTQLSLCGAAHDLPAALPVLRAILRACVQGPPTPAIYSPLEIPAPAAMGDPALRLARRLAGTSISKTLETELCSDSNTRSADCEALITSKPYGPAKSSNT